MSLPASHPQIPNKAAMSLLVISGRSAPELAVLDRLPACCQIAGIGQTLAELSHLTGEQWQGVNVLLCCGTGANGVKVKDIQVCS